MRKKRSPSAPRRSVSVAALATAKLRTRNSDRGSIGARAVASRTRNSREAGDAGEQRDQHQRIRPAIASAARSGRRPGRPGRAPRGRRPGQSMPRHGVGIAALGDRVQREQQRGHDQRHVDPEDEAPGERLGEQAAGRRPGDRRDPAPGGPGADRPSPRLALEGRGDDRQRARDQQGAGEALQRPGTRSGTRCSGRARRGSR